MSHLQVPSRSQILTSMALVFVLMVVEELVSLHTRSFRSRRSLAGRDVREDRPQGGALPYKGYRDENWEDNDGAVNTISMTHLRLPTEHPSHFVVDDSECHPLQPGFLPTFICQQLIMVFWVPKEKRDQTHYEVVPVNNNGDNTSNNKKKNNKKKINGKLWFLDFLHRDFLKVMFNNRKERAELLDGLVISNKDAKVPNLKPRVLLLWGENDSIFHFELVKKMLEQLGEKTILVGIKKAGHLAQLECPCVCLLPSPERIPCQRPV